MQRRQFIGTGAALAGWGLLGPAGRALAADPAATPWQPEGPFYPLQLPADSDADLTRVAGAKAGALGEQVELTGMVLDASGRPMAGARVEIWQVNAHGRYHHQGDRQDKPWDPGFQGYGQTLTRADGSYAFRTIRPVAYPGRTPHIHLAVSAPGARPFVTQLYVEGAPENGRDGILMDLDAAARRRLLVPFERDGAVQRARFQVVLPWRMKA